MDYQDILSRAHIQEISTYILTGTTPIPGQEEKKLEERQEEAYQLIDAALEENSIPEDSPLRDSINEYEYLLSTIYMELGFRAGIAFMMDLQAPAMKEEPDQ